MFKARLVLMIVLAAFVMAPVQAVVYVPADYPTIQQAIDAAAGGDIIIVASGTYTEDIDFLGKDIQVYSDDVNNPANTVISGTGAGSVVTFSSGEDENSILAGFTITGGDAVYGGGIYCENSSPTITNCTFSGNSVIGWDNGGGGGIYCENSSPTITNCTFSGNSASGWYDGGGGMYNNDNSSPTITNCTFSGNSADNWVGGGGGMYNNDSSPTITNCTFSQNSANCWGGGMYNHNNSSPTITNCTFSGNWALVGGGMRNDYLCSPTVTNCTFSDNWAADGGGMYNYNSGSLTVTNCTFSANSAGWDGGGMYNWDSSPTITNCIFSANFADWGGGMSNGDNSNPMVTNCTFSGNSADYGGGMLNSSSSSIPTVTNCILWGNTASDGNEIALLFSSTIDVNYCNVQGGQAGIYNDGGTINWGSGNIDVDPCFVDANGPDGTIGTDDDNLRLLANSNCIDAGDNNSIPVGVTTDIDSRDRITDGDCNDTDIVDMGAYEFALYLGDFYGGCDVDFIDFTVLALAWYSEPGDGNWNEICDISVPSDNIIDELDLKVFSYNWLLGVE